MSPSWSKANAETSAKCKNRRLDMASVGASRCCPIVKKLNCERLLH
jgi:hypothetical protein